MRISKGGWLTWSVSEVAAWQQVLAAVVTTLTTLGIALKWFLEWLFAKLKERDDAFLKALTELHNGHEKQEDSLQAKADDQREKRLEDQRKHIETMHALAEKLTSRSTTPPSR